MKTISLKVEGDEKIKFRIKFDFDEVQIILFEGGMQTKYHDILTLSHTNEDGYALHLNFIAETIQRLYTMYLD